MFSNYKQLFEKIKASTLIPVKKIRNRTPDRVKYIVKTFILPYLGVMMITGFVFLSNFIQASESSTQYLPNVDVMDLNPSQVAQAVNAINPYTPLLEADTVQVVLAMQDEEYVGKPMITSTNNTNIDTTTGERKANINYTVQNGDTLSTIGWNYGLKIASIKVTNSLSSDNIRPGQVLKLPPQDLTAARLAQLSSSSSAKAAVKRPPGAKNNAYPWGWCTYYVATRRYVPGHWGNAVSWLSSAKRAGYPTGSAPAPGAIVVFNVSYWGHVAYVESVSGNSIRISEMNYAGWGKTDERTISAHGGGIMGYIY